MRRDRITDKSNKENEECKENKGKEVKNSYGEREEQEVEWQDVNNEEKKSKGDMKE